MPLVAAAGLLVAAGLVASFALLGAGPAATRSGIGFSAPTFVAMVKTGGEPGIIHRNKFGDLIYSSHEGSTTSTAKVRWGRRSNSSCARA